MNLFKISGNKYNDYLSIDNILHKNKKITELLVNMLFSMIRGTHQRTTFNILKPKRKTNFLILIKLFGGNEFNYWQVFFGGCKYCPIVITETPTCLKSCIVSITSASVSPKPSIIPDLVLIPPSCKNLKVSILLSYFA